MKLILLGAGGTARELIRRLGEIWDLVVVDTSAERLERVRGIRPCREIVGDGSSRVVLERAGLAEADALVAATGDDEANLEACRLARAAGLLRVVAVVNHPEGHPAFRDNDVNAVSPDSLTARRIELALETRRVSSAAFADGKVEVIEFRVEHDSPVRGKAVRDLRSSTWLVGAILRDRRFVALQDDTVLEKDDLVTVVGSGADFGEIVRTFTAGEPRFPLHYGKRVAVVVESERDLQDSLAEAVYLARNSRASALLLVHQDPGQLRDEDEAQRRRDLLARATAAAEGVEVRYRPVSGPATRALPRLHEEESVGVLVVAAPSGRSIGAWFAARRLVRLTRRSHIPILLSRRTHRYQEILVPARRTPAGRAAAHVAIDLARFTGARLSALAMVDLVFTSGPEASAEGRAALDWLKGEAAMQGVPMRGETRRGNPVKSFVQEATEKNLVIVGVGDRSVAWFGTDIPSHLVRRCSCSVLLVPVLE